MHSSYLQYSQGSSLIRGPIAVFKFLPKVTPNERFSKLFYGPPSSIEQLSFFLQISLRV